MSLHRDSARQAHEAAPIVSTAGLTALLESGCPPFMPVSSGRTVGRRGAPPTSATKAQPLRWCASPIASIIGSDNRLAVFRRGCRNGVRRTPREAPRTPNLIVGSQLSVPLTASSAAPVPTADTASRSGRDGEDQFCGREVFRSSIV